MRVAIFLFSMVSLTAWGDTHFHPLFSDNALLQRNTTVPVTVFSDTAQSLSLSLDGKSLGSEQVIDGRWTYSLPAQQAGGPHTLTVTGDNVSLSIQNIYFGDVYLVSGQSNMELTMARVEEAYPTDVEQANYPLIREFTVPDTYDFNTPLAAPAAAQWKTAQTEDILTLSAIAHYFARHIYRYEGVPVGIINASLGGSPIEAWMAPQLLADYPQYLRDAAPFKESTFIEQTRQNDQVAADDWYGKLTRQDEGLTEPYWYSPEFDSADWQTFTVPGTPDFAKEGFTGSWWARKTVNLNVIPQGSVFLRLGRIRDADEVWINGVRVGNTTYHYPPRRYPVPDNVLKKGENTIAVRITANNLRTEFFPDKAYFIGTSQQRISLAGDWQAKPAVQVNEPAPEQTFIRWKPTGLYNAMIAPLTHYPLSGVIWYQGESNTDWPADYSDKLIAMMNHWRSKWQLPELPFFIVQLANYMAPQTAPEESNWAQLRTEQAQAAQSPNAHLVSIIDAGEYNDIHPVNKRIVGNRLASQARRAIYGRDVNAQGPQVTDVSVDGERVTLTITDPQGLRVTAGDGSGFTLAGEDGHFYWANVSHKEDTFTLSHPRVSNPVRIRYAWANNPVYSITDSQGWPLAPFEYKLNQAGKDAPTNE